MVFVAIVAVIVIIYFIKYGIQTHEMNVEEAEKRAEEQRAAAEKAAIAEKKAARVEHFRDHPLMESTVESICKRLPEDIEKAKAAYEHYSLVIAIGSQKISVGTSKYGETLIEFYKQGYELMGEETAAAFAEALKETLEPRAKELGVKISVKTSDDYHAYATISLDFSSYCKPRKAL